MGLPPPPHLISNLHRKDEASKTHSCCSYEITVRLLENESPAPWVWQKNYPHVVVRSPRTLCKNGPYKEWRSQQFLGHPSFQSNLKLIVGVCIGVNDLNGEPIIEAYSLVCYLDLHSSLIKIRETLLFTGEVSKAHQQARDGCCY